MANWGSVGTIQTQGGAAVGGWVPMTQPLPAAIATVYAPAPPPAYPGAMTLASPQDGEYQQRATTNGSSRISTVGTGGVGDSTPAAGGMTSTGTSMGTITPRKNRSALARADLFLGLKAFFPLPRLKTKVGETTPSTLTTSTSTPIASSATMSKTSLIDDSPAEELSSSPASTPAPSVPPKKASTGSPAAVIVGRFQFLKQISGPETDNHSRPGREHLCEYIDIIKGRHDRLFIVSEHYNNCLKAEFTKLRNRGVEGLEELKIRRVAFQILLALSYLNENGIVHRSLASHNVLLDCDWSVKLADWGMFEMTQGGRCVSFPIGTPNYLAPDTIVRVDTACGQTPPSPKEDVWSLGMLLVEMVRGERPWENIRDPQAIMREIVSLVGHTADLLGFQSEETPQQLEIKRERQLANLMSGGRFNRESRGITEGLRDVIALCLKVSPIDRPTPDQLLNHPYFATLFQKQKNHLRWVVKPHLRCLFLEKNDGDSSQQKSQPSMTSPGSSSLSLSSLGISEIEEDFGLDADDATDSSNNGAAANDPLKGKPLAEVFHFWKLAGGNIEKELPQELQISAPIRRIPTIVRLNGPLPHRTEDPEFLYDERIVSVSLAELRSRFSQSGSGGLRGNDFQPNLRVSRHQPVKVPLAIRERDIDYQRERVDIFRELLSRPNNPTSRQEVIREAKIDIPPVLRAEIWALVLGVTGDCQAIYDAIDKESDGPSDHQIELDIPRCHQYHELLSSPEGHRKFRRILKAWVAHNSPDLVYWQGLDSLLAPFLALNFNNEAKAFCCLEAMLNKYVRDFFLKDNVSFLQEHLLIFRQLLAYEDPELFVHFHKMDFHPDLYAIPWFLTLFTHIFPLDKIYWILDTLLLGPRSLALFMALAMMQQLRSKVMNLDFNSCISLFSNLPQIDIEGMINKSLMVFESTPPSLLARKYNLDPNQHSPERWWEVRIPLEQLREEFAPRISLEDVLMYRHSSVLLDVRKPEEFEREHFQDSINLVPQAPNAFAALEQYRGTRIIVIASRGDLGSKVANKLISLKFPSVCVLNGGIDAVRASPKPLLIGSLPS